VLTVWEEDVEAISSLLEVACGLEPGILDTIYLVSDTKAAFLPKQFSGEENDVLLIKKDGRDEVLTNFSIQFWRNIMRYCPDILSFPDMSED